MWVPFLAGEEPLEEEMATHSNILTWETPWTEGAWRATDHRLQKELDMTLQLNTNNTRAYTFQIQNTQNRDKTRKQWTWLSSWKTNQELEWLLFYNTTASCNGVLETHTSSSIVLKAKPFEESLQTEYHRMSKIFPVGLLLRVEGC